MKTKLMDPRLFYLSLFLAFALAMFGNYLFSIFGIAFVIKRVYKEDIVANEESHNLTHCPCCNNVINSTDYGKKVWERSNASE